MFSCLIGKTARSSRMPLLKSVGFKTEVLGELGLQVNSAATLLKLEVGGVSESVAVGAESVTVNTTDSSLDNAIGEKSNRT